MISQLTRVGGVIDYVHCRTSAKPSRATGQVQAAHSDERTPARRRFALGAKEAGFVFLGRASCAVVPGLLVLVVCSHLPCAATPVFTGSQVAAGISLPHVPGDAKVSVSLDGSGVAQFCAADGGVSIKAPSDQGSPHTIAVSTYDPQTQTRLLYSRSLAFHLPLIQI